MTPEMHSKYSDYIAHAVRFIKKETGFYLPENTMLCCRGTSELSDIDDICGFKIYLATIPSSYEFWFCFPSAELGYFQINKSLEEFFNLYDFDIDHNNVK